MFTSPGTRVGRGESAGFFKKQLDRWFTSTAGLLLRQTSGWQKLAALNDTSKFLASDLSWNIPSATGGAGWATALDLDFSAQSSQTLNADTTYSIGGYTWTKTNSANDNVAMAVTNGTGLVIQPKSTSAYNGTTRTSPTLYIDLVSLIPTYYLEMPIRIWVYVSADNISASGDAVGAFMDNLGNSSTIAQVVIDRVNSGGTKLLNVGSALFAASFTANTTTANLNTTDNVLILTLPGGRWLGNTSGYFAAIGGGNAWPSTAAQIPFVRAITATSVATIAQNPVTGLPMKVGVFAQRNGSGTALSVTIMKIRIDYKIT